MNIVAIRQTLIISSNEVINSLLVRLPNDNVVNVDIDNESLEELLSSMGSPELATPLHNKSQPSESEEVQEEQGMRQASISEITKDQEI